MSEAAHRQLRGKATLEVPCDPSFLPVLLKTTTAFASLAGLGPHASGRARSLVGALFSSAAEQAMQAKVIGPCRISLGRVPDGLEICLTTEHLAFDPEQAAVPSVEAVLTEHSPGPMPLYLVTTYARNISLTVRGSDRILCLTLPSHEGQDLSRPWSNLTPTLAEGITLSPMEHQGRLVQHVQGGPDGKSYLAHPLAQQVLGLIDGERTLGSIMAGVLKVMPEVSPHEIEDLFEMLIDRELVEVCEKTPEPPEVEVRKEPTTKHALDAYDKARGSEP